MIYKLTKILKNKKGLTLIELVVGLIIFGIISVAISMVLAPTLFAYMRASDFAEYNALLDNVANHIISDISQITEQINEDEMGVWIDNRDNNGTMTLQQSTQIVRYSVDNAGVLVKLNSLGDPHPVFSEDFYKNKNISIKVDPSDTNATTGDTAYILTIRLTENNAMSNLFQIEREYAVRPLIINNFNEIEDEEDDD